MLELKGTGSKEPREVSSSELLQALEERRPLSEIVAKKSPYNLIKKWMRSHVVLPILHQIDELNPNSSRRQIRKMVEELHQERSEQGEGSRDTELFEDATDILAILDSPPSDRP